MGEKGRIRHREFEKREEDRSQSREEDEEVVRRTRKSRKKQKENTENTSTTKGNRLCNIFAFPSVFIEKYRSKSYTFFNSSPFSFAKENSSRYNNKKI